MGSLKRAKQAIARPHIFLMILNRFILGSGPEAPGPGAPLPLNPLELCREIGIYTALTVKNKRHAYV